MRRTKVGKLYAFAEHKRDILATFSKMKAQDVELRNEIIQLNSRLKATKSRAQFHTHNSAVKTEGTINDPSLMTTIQVQSVVLSLQTRFRLSKDNLRNIQSIYNALETQSRRWIEELERREQAAYTVIQAMSGTNLTTASPSHTSTSASSSTFKRAAITDQVESIKRPRLLDHSADEILILLPAQDSDARSYSDRTFQCLMSTAEGDQHLSSDNLPQAIIGLVL